MEHPGRIIHKIGVAMGGFLLVSNIFNSILNSSNKQQENLQGSSQLVAPQ